MGLSAMLVPSYRLALVVKCLHGDAPSYLIESLSQVEVNPAL